MTSVNVVEHEGEFQRCRPFLLFDEGGMPPLSDVRLKYKIGTIHLTIIIIGDLLNTEFETFDKRHFGAQTAVSNRKNMVYPDWSVHGE